MDKRGDSQLASGLAGYYRHLLPAGFTISASTKSFQITTSAKIVV